MGDVETRTEAFNAREALICKGELARFLVCFKHATNRIAKVRVRLDIERPVLAEGKKGEGVVVSKAGFPTTDIAPLASS